MNITTRVAEIPESPPAIDWNKFKSTVSNKEIVNKLEASYKAAASSLPYPKDSYSDMITRAQEEAVARVKNQAAKYEENTDECRQLVSYEFSKFWE